MTQVLILMAYLFGTLTFQEKPEAPWRSDLQAARQEALKAGLPFVLLLGVDIGGS